MIDSYEIGLGLYIVRLDIAADGRATLTSSYPKGQPSIRNLPNDRVDAFLKALEASQLKDAQPAPRSGVCKGDETVFEAIVEDRYRYVVQPCGDEAGLTKAVEILRAG
jgi:hypothetical protein